MNGGFPFNVEELPCEVKRQCRLERGMRRANPYRVLRGSFMVVRNRVVGELESWLQKTQPQVRDVGNISSGC